MPFCHRCGRELTSEAKFCDACGISVAAPIPPGPGTLARLTKAVKFGASVVILTLVTMFIAFLIFARAPPAEYETLEGILKAVIDFSGVVIGFAGIICVFILSSIADEKRDTRRSVRELKFRSGESQQLNLLISNEQKELKTLQDKSLYVMMYILVSIFLLIATAIISMMKMAGMEPGKTYVTYDCVSPPIALLLIGFAFLSFAIVSGVSLE